MKSVLMSISPYWYYLIGENIKTIEVRKTIPRANDWNGIVECYMTKDMKSFSRIPKEFQAKYAPHMGKVGMRFVCDAVEGFHYGFQEPAGANSVYDCYIGYPVDLYDTDDTCLTRQEIDDYGKKAFLYCWHISDLKIYDKPRELSEFTYWIGFVSDYTTDNHGHLKRPPQSWSYVEELL